MLNFHGLCDIMRSSISTRRAGRTAGRMHSGNDLFLLICRGLLQARLFYTPQLLRASQAPCKLRRRQLPVLKTLNLPWQRQWMHLKRMVKWEKGQVLQQRPQAAVC
jgi:hypothetical protein